ncbi:MULTISPECIES: hypothetical protein [unclassified Saccharothrix]|uniref:hypothetical protein n=1 Tax=unclassified Saccharothrix TaxID=2593673 RepID=UPI00307F89F5
MTALLIALTVLALVVYGLERNHRRNTRGSRLAGSYDVDDRDVARVASELHAAADHQPSRQAPRHARFTPRSA